MGDSMLSTPQKVLRDTLRGKINSSTADFHHSHVVVAEEEDGSTTDEDDYIEEEREIQERREALRQRGRESYAKRKEGSLSSANTTPASAHSSRLRNPLHDIEDDNDDDDDDEGDIFYNESMNNGGKRPPRKKRKSGAGDLAYRPSDGSDTEEDDEGYHDQKPGSAKRRVSSGRPPGSGRSPSAMAIMTTPPSRSRRGGTNTVVSRFKEGSMRDRASAVPPREIVGTLPTSSPRHEDDEEVPIGMPTGTSGLSNILSIGSSAGTAKSADTNGAAKGSFTFGGLASFIPNPFKIVKDAKEAWDRQKQLHEARERKKKILRERKIRGQMAYMDLKKAGTMQGYSGNAAAVMGANAIIRRNSSGSVRVPSVGGNNAPDYNMGETDEQSIGRAYSTDESRPTSQASEQGGNIGSKGRRPELVASFASDKTMKGTGESFVIEGPHQNIGISEVEQNRNSNEAAQHSLGLVASLSGPQENFSRKSVPKPKGTGFPSRVPPPPPLPSYIKTTITGGKFEDVKMLVKKKSKVFASTFGSRGEEGMVSTSFRATSKEGLSKRDIKRQERLQKKVSNLEEQLEKARRELENALDTTINGSIPPLPQISRASRREVLPRLKTTKESIVSGEDTEGDETEIDEAPLSPVMNGGSFGGSFMAKTAEMTIMESVEEVQPETMNPSNGKGGVSLTSGLGMSKVLPKRVSKPNLGVGRRRRVSGPGPGPGTAGPSSSSGSGLRPQSKSMADIRGKRNSPPPPHIQSEKVPPMPKAVGENGSQK